MVCKVSTSCQSQCPLQNVLIEMLFGRELSYVDGASDFASSSVQFLECCIHAFGIEFTLCAVARLILSMTVHAKWLLIAFMLGKCSPCNEHMNDLHRSHHLNNLWPE